MAYDLPIYSDAELGDDYDPSDWTAQDYTLCVVLGVTDNYEADRLVEAELARRDPALAARIRFDSEFGCFFAHGAELDIRALKLVVQSMVASAGFPNAVPGDMGASPAFIERF